MTQPTVTFNLPSSSTNNLPTSLSKLTYLTLCIFTIGSMLTACQKPNEKEGSEANTTQTQSETVGKQEQTQTDTPAEAKFQTTATGRTAQIEQLAGISKADLIKFDPQEMKQGGHAGINIDSTESYSKPSSNISPSRKGHFFIGNAFFKQPWVVAPASTDSRDGLGPLFNVAACQSCHIKDGRGHPPVDANDTADSMLIRLALPPTTDKQKQQLANSEIEKVPHPVYGGQLQDRGIPGVHAEAHIDTKWTDVPVKFKDGHVETLRRPTFTFSQVGYGAFGDEVMVSPRIALPMIGLGLLEHIKAEDIKMQADPDDKDGNGISGKANQVISSLDGSVQLGRFGWKAGQPFLVTQNQGAFNGDMGLTSHLNPNSSCTPSQTACLKAPSGADDQQDGKEPVEVSDDIVKFVEFYTRNLAVPNRRHADDPQVLAGKKRFYDMGCINCHTPRYQLPTTAEGHLEQDGQIIYPYTDMLLHDMGDDLADRTLAGKLPDKDVQVEFLATSYEWRTQPLWGIGLARIVDKEAGYLHDGRARTPLEAVLWHGGEAEDAKNKVLELDKQGRAELEAFLGSL